MPRTSLIAAVILGSTSALADSNATAPAAGTSTPAASFEAKASAGGEVSFSAKAGPGWVLDDDGGARSYDVDLTYNLWPFGTLNTGISAFFAYPIMPQGFIGKVNDEFEIVGGSYLEYYRRSDSFVADCTAQWWRLTPLVGARYAFHFTPAWTAFLFTKVGYAIGFADSFECKDAPNAVEPEYSNPKLDLGLGAYWQLLENLDLAFKISNFGPAAGVSLKL